MSKAQYFTNPFLDEMRQKTDPPADNAFKALHENYGAAEWRETMAAVVYNYQQWPEDLPAEASSFFTKTGVLPGFAKESSMKRGATFFAQNAEDILSMLGFASLPYCYAAVDGARVLQQSPRLVNDPERRLLETARFVMDIMDPLAFTQQGKGFRSIQKVRLTHAAIRYYIQKGRDWQAEVWGKPVNQEDMAGTQLAFWYIPITSMRKIGLKVSKEEADDFRHLWNVTGYLGGVDERLLPDSTHESYLMNKRIAERNFAASDHGQSLTRSLINYFKEAPVGNPLSRVTEPYIRYLIGDDVADILGVKGGSFTSTLLKPIIGLSNIRSVLRPGNKFYSTRNILGRQIRERIGEEARGKSFRLPDNLKSGSGHG